MAVGRRRETGASLDLTVRPGLDGAERTPPRSRTSRSGVAVGGCGRQRSGRDAARETWIDRFRSHAASSLRDSARRGMAGRIVPGDIWRWHAHRVRQPRRLAARASRYSTCAPSIKSRPVALAGTAGADQPFFSPDGQWVGFFRRSGLARVAIGGGVPATIEASAGYGVGAAWAADDSVIFSHTPFSGLRRVPISGGDVQTLTLPGSDRREVGHVSPEMLPGNQAFVFTVTSADSFASSKIAVYTFEGAQRRILLDGGMSARYASSGHLVYARESTLMAVPFDPKTLELRWRAGQGAGSRR